jgi:exopolysaccharide biosynthesis protein
VCVNNIRTIYGIVTVFGLQDIRYGREYIVESFKGDKFLFYIFVSLATDRLKLCNTFHIRKLDGTNSEITSKTFDAVMICNGRYWDQAKPNIPGMEKFKGVIVHSGDYRTFHPYVGKQVVVVGCSHSAGMYRIYQSKLILYIEVSYLSLPVFCA